MQTLKELEKEFDKEFFIIPQPLLPQGEAQERIKSFISTSLRELLEQVVPEEKHKRCENCATFSECDCMEYSHAFNACRSEVEERIKKILS